MSVNLNLSICLLCVTRPFEHVLSAKLVLCVWSCCLSIDRSQFNTELLAESKFCALKIHRFTFRFSSAKHLFSSKKHFFVFSKHSTLIIDTTQLQIYDMTLSVDEMHYYPNPLTITFSLS